MSKRSGSSAAAAATERLTKYVKQEERSTATPVRIPRDSIVMELKREIAGTLVRAQDLELVDGDGKVMEVNLDASVTDALAGRGDSQDMPIVYRFPKERPMYELSKMPSELYRKPSDLGLSITPWREDLPTEPFNEHSFTKPAGDADHNAVLKLVTDKILPAVLSHVPPGKWAWADVQDQRDELKGDEDMSCDLSGSPGDIIILPDRYVKIGESGKHELKLSLPTALQITEVVIEAKSKTAKMEKSGNFSAQLCGQLLMTRQHQRTDQPILGLLMDGEGCWLRALSKERHIQEIFVSVHEAANQLTQYLRGREPHMRASAEPTDEDEDDDYEFEGREEHRAIVRQSQLRACISQYVEGVREGRIAIPHGWTWEAKEMKEVSGPEVV
ncbi:unnamed protein product [Vitrella brassicaformis CCMP3155]|uniref:Uncharacterized protein n=2 Tax=Vitrella brassicaformis TaxID=1169539 RepID=A0A0G4FQV0_VITBC|nr:unnamed protein product [Vitrella brassicaformis CCMP3155]|eukprot:CEM16596.1 unnamed protein product [Vitrella brassicaformis CCMP3155]